MLLIVLFFQTLHLVTGTIDVTKLPTYQSLVGFWPLNEESGRIGYYANGAMMLPVGGLPQLVQGSGPFQAGAYSVGLGNRSIAEFKNDLTNPASFTISFYFKSPTSKLNETGIFTTHSSFDLFYQPRSDADSNGYIVLHGIGNTLLAPQEPGQWIFIACSYDAATKELVTYFQPETSSILLARKITLPNAIVRSRETANIGIGTSSFGGMTPKSELGCLVFYSTVLGRGDVEELRWACRTADVTKVPPDETHLLGIWPLSDKSGCCNGYYGNRVIMSPTTKGAVREVKGRGPFKDGAFAVNAMGGYLANYMLISPKSFTTSLHFRLTEMLSQKTGLFNVHSNFHLNYLPPTTPGGNGSIVLDGKDAKNPVTLLPIQQSDLGQWFFIASTYSNSLKRIDVYYQSTGFLKLNKASFNYTIEKQGEISTATIGSTNVLTTNEFACVTLYSTALDQGMIEDLRYACRVPQQATTNTSAIDMLPEHEKLLGFWPLSSNARLNGYHGNGIATAPANTGNVQHLPNGGPFGGGSYTVASNNTSLAMYQFGVPNPSSFTISLLFKSTSTRRTGIFSLKDTITMFYDPNGTDSAQIGVTAFKAGSSVWNQNDTVFFANHAGPRIGQWIFLAITYDARNASLVTFFQHLPLQNGSKFTTNIPKAFQVNRYPDIPTFPALGVGYNGSGWIFMTPKDEIACINVYSSALTQKSVEDLRWACLDPGMRNFSKEALEQLETTSEKGSISSLVPRSPVRPEFLDNTREVMKRCNHFDSNRATPPLGSKGEPLPITAAFQINCLREISNLDEAIAVNAILFMKWQIDTCPWNSSTVVTDRLNEEVQVVSSSDIWLPKVRFVSAAAANVHMKRVSVGDDFLVTMQTSPKSVNRTFNFYWTREGSFSAYCPLLGLPKFPFDTQTCTFEFALLRERSLVSFNDKDIHFYLGDGWTENTEWSLVSTKQDTSWQMFNGFEVSTVRFVVTLERISIYYIQNLFVPVAILGILILAGFSIPPDDSARPSFTVTIVLTLTVAQGAVLSQIPKKPYSTMLGNYVCMVTWFAVGCTVYQLVSLLLARSIFGGKAPQCGSMITLVRLIDVAALIAAGVVFVVINVLFLVYV